MKSFDADIKTTIEPDDIEWEWENKLNSDGTRWFPDRPEKKVVFEPQYALAMLLINEIIYINNHWWEKDWPEKAQKITYLGVNCNDIFAWACSDSEELEYKDIEPLYRMWAKDPCWGPAIWCLIKRKEMPQRPVEQSIRNAGIWDMDALKAEHALRANCYDGVSSVLAKRKYDTYCTWETSRGKEPRPFDANWWAGWNEYMAANPEWNNEEWKADDAAAYEQWQKENGYVSNS